MLTEHRRHGGADAAGIQRIVDVGDEAAVLAEVAGTDPLDEALDDGFNAIGHQNTPTVAADDCAAPDASATGEADTSVTESVLASISWE